MIDALNDSLTTPFGTAGTVNVLTNDTNAATAATLANVTLTQTVAPTGVSTFNAATGDFSVPASAPAGTYTVSYQICAVPATTPAACDNATATIVVGAAADMSVAITGLPLTAGPGAVLSGNVVCTNVAATTAATAPTCAAAAGTPAGATVVVGACTPALPVASLAAGANISCAITVTMPGTAGGTDTTQTSVGVNGTTSATNDGNAANNTTSVTLAVIDALNDSLGPIGSTAGGTTPSVLVNDQVDATVASTSAPANVVLTTNGSQGFTGSGVASTLTLNANGTITVPADATPGSYTVPYQICVTPATTPVACDTGVATVLVTGAPGLQVTKIAGVPTVAAGSNPERTDAGDTVSYSFSVLNTGNVDLTNVTISDPKLPLLSCTPVSTLAVGAASAVACASGNVYTLTAADVAAGSTTNVATGTGTAPPDTCAISPCLVTGTGTATVPSTPNSGITVTKLANPGVLPAVGGVISYSILVENTGKTALTGVNVTDPIAGTVTCPGGNPIPLLALNASVTCSASYTVTAADVVAGSKTNVATATGTAPPNTCAAPPCTVTGSGTTTVSTPSSAPEIKVVKKASPTTASTIGQIIDYTIVGSNTGNVTLTNVSISDNKIAALTCVPAAPATLLVGQTITCTGSYTLTAADAATGSLTNIATASGTPPIGPPVTATGTATTPVVPIANDDTDSTTLNQPVTTPVSPNDSYPPGSTVSTGGTSTNGGLVSCTPATPASCTYTPPAGFVGTDTYTYRLCLPAPNGSVCDTAIVTISVNSSDMGVAITGLPATAGPGAVITGTLACTNLSTSVAALAATCSAAPGTPAGATVTVGQCTINGANVTLPTSVGSAAPNNAIICPITVTMPVNPANSDVPQTSIGITGSTSASNDSNTTNNSTSAALNIIDAVNDSATGPFGPAVSVSVLTNDQSGTSPVATGNVTITQTVQPTAGSTFDAATGTFAVAANAAPGVYTVTYQICVNPATVPPACDTATATINIGSGSSISGNVFNDLNGATDNLVNGAGTNTGTAGALTVYLVDAGTGAVVGESLVSATGVYSFPLVANGNYTLVLSTTPGQVSSPTASLPAGWVNTGEGLTPAGTAPADGSITAVTVSGTNISGVNFGIEQPPLGQSNTANTQANPGGAILVPVAPTTFTTGATDPSGGTITGYQIGFPTGADSITVNGTNYTAATFATAFPGGSVFVPAADIGGILVDPAGSGTGPGTVQIPFRPVDNAGIASSTIYNANVPLGSGSSVAGNVFNDGNGLTDLAVNGTGSNAGGLTAYLVNATTGAVVASSAVAANGSYSFVNVADGTYNVVISATAGQVANPTANLPANWVNTGEGVNPAGDGVVDGRVTGVVVNGTGISGVNFGIEQRPVAGGAAVPSQANPGGTTSVPVPASAFQTGTSDADGVVTSYLITAFPSNVTSITIGGTTYTATGVNGTTVFPVSGVTVPAANIGSVSVDPVDGIANVVIAFTVTDNAGIISGNVGSVTVPFGPAIADLAVQKNGPAVVQVSSQITYTINLINNGLSAADGATFVDTLPAGLTGVSAACTGVAGAGTSACAAVVLTVTASSISGSVPRFPSGGSVLITVRATAPATIPAGPLVNTVTITVPAGVTDPVPSNNTSSVTTTVGTAPREADISVVKTGPSAVQVLGVVSYVIDVVNGGPGSADGSVFTDTVPVAITGVIWTCTASGQAVCPAASGSGNTISQTLVAMPMNGRLRYAITGTAPAAATTLVNTANVSTPTGLTDPNPNNNTSTVSTIVSTTPPTVANLSMSKIGPTTVAAFGAVRYTLVATNNGPANADGATVTDTFPSVLTGVTWTCAASVGATCGAASGSGNLNLAVPAFAAGSQVTITVNGTAPSSGTFQNSARVTAPPTVTDPDPSDNIGGPVVTTVLLAPADLVTTVTVAPTVCPGFARASSSSGKARASAVDRQKCPPGNPAPGQPVIATVVMSNIGPSPAGNVIVTLQLPPGSTGVVVSSGGVYNPATSTVTWPVIPFVPANTSPVVTYTVVFVPPVTGGTIRSDVITSDTEVTLTNNPASVSIRVVAVVVAPEPIPTAPWWMAALLLAGLAGRSLRRRVPVREA